MGRVENALLQVIVVDQSSVAWPTIYNLSADGCLPISTACTTDTHRISCNCVSKWAESRVRTHIGPIMLLSSFSSLSRPSGIPSWHNVSRLSHNKISCTEIPEKKMKQIEQNMLLSTADACDAVFADGSGVEVEGRFSGKTAHSSHGGPRVERKCFPNLSLHVLCLTNIYSIYIVCVIVECLPSNIQLVGYRRRLRACCQTFYNNVA